MYTALAQKPGLSPKELAVVYDGLRELGEDGPGRFIVPGLSKVKAAPKPPERVA